MESSLYGMNSDLLVDIMSCMDGATLAATACTCSGLRDAATDQSLWQNLCHSTWPSTSLKQAQRLISSSHIRGFDKFYADSFPLILWDQEASGVHFHRSASQHQNRATHISPSDFLSLVDVYCQGKCILSRVVDGIPEAVDVYDHDNDNIANPWDFPNNDNQQWFSNCPFRLDVLASTPNRRDARNDIEIENAYSDHHSTNADCCITYLPSIYSSEVDDGSRKGDLCEKLAKGVRLSWILLDKKRGKAVNLSSWKPLSVQRSWPSYGDYLLHFGSTIAVEANVLPQKLAECIILARCELVEKGGYVKWKEVSMRLKDDVGAHVNAKKSLMALNHALYSLRTVKHLEVERRHGQYKQHKIEMKRRQDQKESLADKLYALLEIAIFSAICYGCSLLF